MIDRAEQDFIPNYLAAARFLYQHSVTYEFMVTATLARDQIHASLDGLLKGTCRLPGIRLIPRAGPICPELLKKLCNLRKPVPNLPSVSPSIVPADSILQEFI